MTGRSAKVLAGGGALGAMAVGAWLTSCGRDACSELTQRGASFLLLFFLALVVVGLTRLLRDR